MTAHPAGPAADIDALLGDFQRACEDVTDNYSRGLPSHTAEKERAILRNEIRSRLLATPPAVSPPRDEASEALKRAANLLYGDHASVAEDLDWVRLEVLPPREAEGVSEKELASKVAFLLAEKHAPKAVDQGRSVKAGRRYMDDATMAVRYVLAALRRPEATTTELPGQDIADIADDAIDVLWQIAGKIEAKRDHMDTRALLDEAHAKIVREARRLDKMLRPRFEEDDDAPASEGATPTADAISVDPAWAMLNESLDTMRRDRDRAERARNEASHDADELNVKLALQTARLADAERERDEARSALANVDLCIDLAVNEATAGGHRTWRDATGDDLHRCADFLRDARASAAKVLAP